MRRTWVAFVIAAVAVTALAGCTGVDPARVLTYQQIVHPMPAYKGVTDDALTTAAQNMCAMFKTDKSAGWSEAMKLAMRMQTGADRSQADLFVSAAVDAYCPQYSAYLK